MGSNTYTVTVNLNQATMDRLNGINPHGDAWSLIGFKAVSGPSGGKPVVWFSKTGTFMPSIVLEWEEDDYAYISEGEQVAGGVIKTAFPAVAISPNQTAAFNGSDFNVSSSGAAGADAQNIIVYNKTSDANIFCGLAKRQPSVVNSSPDPVPICCFEVDGGNEVVMLPRVKILLAFVSEQVNTASVAERALGPGVFVTLTGHAGDDTTFTLTYDKDKNWEFGGAGWGEQVAPNQELAPILNPDATAPSGGRRLKAATA